MAAPALPGVVCAGTFAVSRQRLDRPRRDSRPYRADHAWQCTSLQTVNESMVAGRPTLSWRRPERDKAQPDGKFRFRSLTWRTPVLIHLFGRVRKHNDLPISLVQRSPVRRWL